jgi:hypothetical protein
MSTLQKNMKYWGGTFLPSWVIDLQYSAITPWRKLLGKLGGLPARHLGKSRLKRQQHHHHSWKASVGGCGTVVWADPPQGPPTDFRKTIAQGVYSFSWIVSKRLDKQIKNDRPPVDRIIENPDCAYSYQTRAEPECGFSGDQGELQCTHALKPDDNNLDYHKRNSQSMRNLVKANLAKSKGVK